MRLKALDHVGLKVRDLDKSLDFYQRLGLTVLRTKGPNTEGARFAVIQVGDQELNVSFRPEYASPANDSAVGIDHFCFEVDAASMDDVVADLRKAGIEILSGPMQRRDGSALFVLDPDGIHVELQLKGS